MTNKELLFFLCALVVGTLLGGYAVYDFHKGLKEKSKRQDYLMDFCYESRQFECILPLIKDEKVREDYWKCIEPIGYACSVGGEYEQYAEEYEDHKKLMEEIENEKLHR